MASSQVEIAASAPFGCILRDHNRRDRCSRDSNAFRKNLKDLVTRINISPDPNNTEQRPDRKNLKLTGGGQKKDVLEGLSSAVSPGQSLGVLERWPTRDKTSTVEKQSHDAELVASDQSAASVPSDQSPTGPSNLGASSLVQIWEARLGQSHSMNRTAASGSRSNSPLSCSNEEPSRKSGAGDPFEENRPSHDGLIGDWESDRAIHEGPDLFSSSSSTSSSMSQDRSSDPRESLKTPRVADIIRRLISASDENDNELSSNAGAESPSRERDRSVGSDHSLEQQRGFVVMHTTNSPRLRGRQAFNDLLMNMERDRQRELDSLGERRAVSRFSQKGRIQSHLRLKVLQRGMGVHVQVQQRPRSSGSSEGSTSSHSSAIVHLREKFTVEISKVAGTAQNNASTNPSPPQTQSTNNWPGSEDYSSNTGDQTIVRENRHVEAHDVLKQDPVPENKEPAIAEDPPDERSVTSKITFQVTRLEPDNLELQEQEVANLELQGQVVTCLELQEQTESFTSMNGCWYEEGTAEEEGQESNMEEELGTSESGYEWFLGVCRPRSYWEDQRQAWYRKMLETESENSEIRRLLERRSVSTFLSSDFRDRMNCLMANHLQRQTHQMSEHEDDMSNEERMNSFLSSFLQNHSRSDDRKQGEELQEKGEGVTREKAFQEGEVDEQIFLRSQERREQLIEEEEEEEEEQFYLTSQQRMDQSVTSQLNSASVGSQEEGDRMGLQEEEGYMEREEEEEEEQEQEEEDEEQGDIIIEEDDYEREDHNDDYMEEEVEVEGEDENLIGQRYHEASEYFDHSNPSSVTMPLAFMRSWSYRSHEMNNNDHQPVASTSSRETHNMNPYYHDAWQPCNSINRLSIEMELINDLRGQMKQLHQEMSELRKSINCCMDMQVKLQDSIKEEIFSARGERMKPQQGAVRKGRCRICYKKQVNSLLYRCGHMCTCLKCAQELQWNSGKCPICQAPIVDVVQVHRDS